MRPPRPDPCPSCRQQRHLGEPDVLRCWCSHRDAGRLTRGLHAPGQQPRTPPPRGPRSPGPRHRRPLLPGAGHAAAPDPAPRPLLVYLFDPYCPWSYGYLPALSGLLDQVGSEADLEVVNIGLHDRTRIASTAPPLLAVQRSTGVGFGPAYRRALAAGEMELTSRDAASAVIALVAADPGRVTETLWAVHRAHFWSGLSFSQPGTAARVAGRLGLDADAVELFARSERAGALADDDFTLARDLGARRGPTLLVSHGDQLCEFEGPGSSGENLLEQFRSVLARP